MLSINVCQLPWQYLLLQNLDWPPGERELGEKGGSVFIPKVTKLYQTLPLQPTEKIQLPKNHLTKEACSKTLLGKNNAALKELHKNVKMCKET